MATGSREAGRHVSDARGLDDADFYSRPMNLRNKPGF